MAPLLAKVPFLYVIYFQSDHSAGGTGQLEKELHSKNVQLSINGAREVHTYWSFHGGCDSDYNSKSLVEKSDIVSFTI